MEKNNINQIFDELTALIPQVPLNKKYWLIRTQSGSYYETFRENRFISIEHNDITLSRLSEIAHEYKQDKLNISKALKTIISESFLKQYGASGFDQRQASRVASQIFRFVFQMKKGDMVVIPSEASSIISFGEITQDYLGQFTPEEMRKMQVSDILLRRVKWIKDVRRENVDPYIYRLFLSHQAVNDVTKYAEIIERSINDFFILDEEAHLVLDVRASSDIKAKHLFGLGYDIISLVEEYAEYANIDINTEDIEATVNLNSPGKIDLKAKTKKVTLVTGLILLVAGGGVTSKWGNINTQGLPAVLKSIDDFLNHSQERDLKREMFNKYKDSLDVKNPEDLINLMKQVSENKDISK